MANSNAHKMMAMIDDAHTMMAMIDAHKEQMPTRGGAAGETGQGPGP